VKRWLPADGDVTLTNTPDWDATEGHLATNSRFPVRWPWAVRGGLSRHLFQVNEKHAFRIRASKRDLPRLLIAEMDEVHVTLPTDLEVESLPPNDDVRLDYAYTDNPEARVW